RALATVARVRGPASVGIHEPPDQRVARGGRRLGRSRAGAAPARGAQRPRYSRRSIFWSGGRQLMGLRGLVRSVALVASVAASLLLAPAPMAVAATCPWMNSSLPAEQRAQMLLGAMSLPQKIAMTYQRYPIDLHYGAAGWIPAQTGLCIPDLVLNDAGEGVGDGQLGVTAFPAPIAQSSSWDPALQYAFGQALGQEAWGKGIDVQLAPGIETDR